ncbi:hypothetical protein V6N13_127710 [Hibiscus sabdariffa]|uniref:Uncharacterized protein n=1 Tax=Hibiscus sabdariffa TaxID=183260 RepID=A0ABR2CE90_9ROSI
MDLCELVLRVKRWSFSIRLIREFWDGGRHGDHAGYQGPSQHGNDGGRIQSVTPSFRCNHDGWTNEKELKEALHSPKVRFGWWKARQGMKEADCNQSTVMVNLRAALIRLKSW